MAYMLNISKFLVALILFGALTLAPSAQGKNSYIWIGVSILDAGNLTKPAEYFGKIKRSQFTNLVTNSQTRGFFKLENVYWFTKKGTVKRASSVRRGDSILENAYSDRMYFRIEDVKRIVELDASFVSKHLIEKI